MRVLITGGSGVVGSYYVKNFVMKRHEVHYTSLNNSVEIYGAERHTVNLGKNDEVDSIIAKIKPELVIHTAALSSVDTCEINRNLAYEVNVNGTSRMVDLCRSINSFLIYISTTSVFDGIKDIYNELDRPNPINYYAYTKMLGENLVKRLGQAYLILRIDQPYGWIMDGQKQNSVVRALNKLDSDEVLNEIIDWYNNPTFLNDIVDATDLLLNNNKTGLYHAVGPDHIDRYSWSLIVADIFERDKNLIKPISASQLHLPAKRPNVNASNAKIKDEVGFTFAGIRDGLLHMKSHKDQRDDK